MCRHLEAITFGDLTRLLVNVPPGFMKSLLVNVFWPAWEWGPMGLSSMRYVAFSYASSLTERDNGKFRDLILSAEYQALWGHVFELRTVGVTKIENNKTGWKLASSIGGVGTGERGDRVLLDDPHNVKEAESETVRGDTTRWFVETMSNRLNDLDESAIIVIMQRVHEADVSGVIIGTTGSMGYAHLMIPWDYDDSPGRHCVTPIGWEDPRTQDGEPAWPERFSANAMSVFRRHPFMWSAQYQQAPVPRGGSIIKDAWWEMWGKEQAQKCGLEWSSEKAGRREMPAFDFVIGSLDTAYTKDKENDYSALTIWGIWTDHVGNRRFMLANAWQDRLEFHDLIEKVAASCRKYRVDRLLIEDKAAGHSVSQELRRVHAREKWGVQLINPGSLDKVARAHSIVHLFTDGLIWAPAAWDDESEFTAWASDVIGQCASFPKGSHDDLVDSVTMALKWLRDAGLAVRNEEYSGMVADASMHRSRNVAPLYPGC